MTTTHDPIQFFCGDTWILTGTVNDEDGLPLNLNNATIAWKLDSVDGTINNLTLTIGGGVTILDSPSATIEIEVPASQTAALPPGLYADYLRVTMGDGSVFTEWTGVIRAAPNPN